MSTLKAIFQGRRELFRGRAIDSLPYGWHPHSVIHVDLDACQAESEGKLEQSPTYEVDSTASHHGITLTQQGAAVRFRDLIDSLSATSKVVILVDRCDKPLLGHMGQPESVRVIQAALKSFFSVSIPLSRTSGLCC